MPDGRAFPDLDQDARKVLKAAESAARQLGRSSIDSDLILVGCLQVCAPAAQAADALGVSLEQVCAEVERLPHGLVDDGPSTLKLGADAGPILRLAAKEAHADSRRSVSAADMFVAILQHGQSAKGQAANSSLVLARLGLRLLPLRLKLLQVAKGDALVHSSSLPTLPEIERQMAGIAEDRTQAISRGDSRKARRLGEQEAVLRAVRDLVAGRSRTGSSRVGSVLGQRYRLDERIAGGGMGEVWKGTDEVLGRIVAVKFLLPTLLNEAGFAERFRAEARIMATTNHPGIVDIYDYGQEDGAAFIVMEYVDGQTLSHALSRIGRLTPARTMALIAQAADALHAAHEKGIVHRDVKPSNLMVRPNGTLVLTDFGISGSIDTSRFSNGGGMMLGTAPYISPEQVTGARPTPLSDVYSLGVVAYRCLSGQLPFEGSNPLEIAMRHVRDSPPPLPADIPPLVRRLVELAMAKDPGARWPNAAALGRAARQVATGASEALGPTATSPFAAVDRLPDATVSAGTTPPPPAAGPQPPAVENPRPAAGMFRRLRERAGQLLTGTDGRSVTRPPEPSPEPLPPTGVLIKAVGASAVDGSSAVAEPLLAETVSLESRAGTVYRSTGTFGRRAARLPQIHESTAVLIGAAQYLDPDLPPIPSVVNNIDDLAAVLGDPLRGGFDPARIHRILDPALDVAAQVHELIEPVQDTVLVYFAGHGLIGSDAQLYLGLAATRSSRVPYTALQYDKLRQALLDSSAVNTVLVLDCCFSGMALRHMGGRPGDVAAGMVDIEGTYILTATSATRLAHAPEGERNSAFTGELLNILRGGLPDAGDLLELGDIYDPLCAAMRARSLPSPQQRGSNTIGSLALVRNQAAPG